jgi:hypothetical protein
MNGPTQHRPWRRNPCVRLQSAAERLSDDTTFRLAGSENG